MACVLVVDDEADIRDTMKDLLESAVEGVRVRTAESGAQGLVVLQEEGGNVRPIISDYRMPGMSGTEFLTAAGELAPSVPSFLVTGYDLDESAAGPNGFVMQKPLEPGPFLGMVEKVLGGNVGP